MVLYFLIFHFFHLIFILIQLIPIEYPTNLWLHMVNEGSGGSTPLADFAKTWPSGVPQSGAIISTGFATYAALLKLGITNPRLRAGIALTSMGVSTAVITAQTIIENSVGFNRLMWGYSEYNRTNRWPSADLAYAKSDAQMNEFVKAQVNNLTAEQLAAGDVAAKELAKKSSEAQSFLPSTDGVSELIIKLYENLFREIMQLFKPVVVQGHFDDLVGQRMFLEFILFMVCIFVGILFIIFLFNLLVVFNKDRIINYFPSG